MLEDVDASVIRERHVVERHVAADLRQRLRIRRIVHRDRLVDHLKDALEVRHGVDEGVVEVRKLEDRLPEAPRVGGDRDQRTDLHRGAEQRKADQVHRADDPGRDVVDRDPNEVRGVLRLHPALVHLGVERVVDFRVLLLARKRLRDLHAVEAFVQVGVQVGALVRDVLPGAALRGLQDQHDDKEQRDAGHDDQRELHVAQEHEDGDQDQVENLEDKVDDAVRERIGNGVDIIYDAREDLAVRAVIVELEGEPLQMLEQILADVVDDLLSHNGHVARTLDREKDRKQDRDKHDPGEQKELREVLVRHRVVQRDLDQLRADECACRGNGGENDGEDHLLRVALDVHAGAQQMLDIKWSFECFVHIIPVSGHYATPPSPVMPFWSS